MPKKKRRAVVLVEIGVVVTGDGDEGAAEGMTLLSAVIPPKGNDLGLNDLAMAALARAASVIIKALEEDGLQQVAPSNVKVTLEALAKETA